MRVVLTEAEKMKRKNNPRGIRKTGDERVFSTISFVLCGLGALLCALPFWLILAGSFSNENDILKYGYSVWPRTFSLDAYQTVFAIPDKILSAYGISILVTAVGGAVGLFLTTMTAYVLMRPDFRYRKGFAFYLYIPTVFSGGMIPTYILMVVSLKLKNNILALILPGLMSTWNTLLMRNFMRGIPPSIMESAKIDGANDMQIFLHLYLRLSGPGLATIGLFIALGYWNDWFNAMLYIERSRLFPLQYLLYRMFSNIEAVQEASSKSRIVVERMPTETFKMAMAIVTTGPIIFLYPFVQRYFVKGLTIGSVKG